jgi:hypothetical protein
MSIRILPNAHSAENSIKPSLERVAEGVSAQYVEKAQCLQRYLSSTIPLLHLLQQSAEWKPN